MADSRDILQDIFSGKLDDAVSTEYFAKLGKSTFDEILLEPTHLTDETKILTDQTQELALTNYRTFVETADCSNRILNDFNTSKSSLSNVINKMPHLISECDNFVSISKNIIKERGYSDNIQSQQDQLLSIVELPAIMQSALAQGDYESALDLFTYIRNLSRRYNDVRAIQNITSEVTRLWFETLHRLFNQLRYDLPLPQCLNVLGYLRRANAVYETAMDESAIGLSEVDPGYQFKLNKMRNVGDGLQLHFLKARGTWFDNLLSEETNDDGERQLRKIVELHRVHLFNILTQHKAIFLSENQGSKIKQEDLNGVAALSCWLKEKVDRLINILQQNASSEDEPSLESLVNQCMYLCLSFGRVGADMRAVMTPLFYNVISSEFSKSITKVDIQFEKEMKHFKLVTRKLPRKNVTDNEQQEGPPESLLGFYPLAEYCNGVLTALNSLRVIAPMCMAHQVLNKLFDSLNFVSKNICNFYHREQQAFSPSEKEVFVVFCNIYTDELIPYIQSCICQVFSPSVIAEQLGITLVDFHQEKLLVLDRNVLTSPITEVLSLINV